MIQFLILFPLLIVISFVFLIVYGNQKSARSKINLPPGSFGWPFIGEFLSLLRASWEGVPERFVQERIEKYGSPLVFKTYFLGNRVAVLCGPSSNKFLFGNENKKVGMWSAYPVRKLLGNSLIGMRGDEANWVRKMMLTYLGPDAFTRHYVAAMDVVSSRHIETHWRGKEQIQAYQTVKLYAFELVCRLLLSLEEPTISKLMSLFNIFLKGVIEIPINLPGFRYHTSQKAATAIRTEFLTITRARRVALAEGKASPSQDLLSHFLTSSDENGRFLTEMEIANNFFLLLFAGHDTSTCAITMLIKRLGEHPDVYNKVLNEHMEISKTKEAGELLKWEDIQKMRYSWSVTSEVMRLTVPSNGGFREALVDIEYAGYTIPKGWKLFWSAASHKDEAIFKDATRFDPSRFEGVGPDPFTYVPFGGGARMCVGQEFARVEILVFLHHIITKFKWDLMLPDEKITYDPMATPAKGLPIRLHSHQL